MISSTIFIISYVSEHFFWSILHFTIFSYFTSSSYVIDFLCIGGLMFNFHLLIIKLFLQLLFYLLNYYYYCLIITFFLFLSTGAMAYVAVFELLTDAIEDTSVLTAGTIGCIACAGMILTQELVKGSL